MANCGVQTGSPSSWIMAKKLETEAEKRLKVIFKERLKHYRDLRRMTQDELSEAVGLSTVFVAELELGRKTPSLGALANLAKVLQIEPYQLLIVLDDEHQTLLADFLRTILVSGDQVLLKGFGPIKGLKQEKTKAPVSGS